MTISPRTSAAAVMLLGLALASCGWSGDKGSGQSAGDGEILEGSISDDMLPYDTVRSQPPLAAPEPTGGANANGDDAKSAEGGADAAGEAQAEGEAGAETQNEAAREEQPAASAAPPAPTE